MTAVLAQVPPGLESPRGSGDPFAAGGVSAESFDAVPFDAGLFDVPFLPDPLGDVDPFVLLGPLDDLSDPADRVDPVDLTRHPWSVEAELEFAGVAASIDALAELCADLDSAEQEQFAANRATAAHLSGCRRVLDVAARNPAVYLQPGELGRPEASELAVRAAATELSMRLHVSVSAIRNRAHESDRAARPSPRRVGAVRRGHRHLRRRARRGRCRGRVPDG